MRFLLGLSALLFSCSFAFAQSEETEAANTHIEYITGHGQYSAYCNANDYFCVDNVKRYSQQEATRDAQWSCQLRKGQTDFLAPTCSDFCSPSYMPPGGGSQWVNCRSDCSIRCEIPDQQIEEVE